jgi:hypothetical protein
MNPRNGPDRLSTDLRQLEAPTVSADFTDRVLAALDARTRKRRQRRALGLALAVPTAVALFAGPLLLSRSPGEPRAARAEELQRQRRLLQAELAQLRQARDQPRTVLYLGTGEDYDLVLDLDPLLAQSIRTPVVPALQDLRVEPARVVEAARRRP